MTPEDRQHMPMVPALQQKYTIGLAFLTCSVHAADVDRRRAQTMKERGGSKLTLCERINLSCHSRDQVTFLSSSY